MDRLRRRRLEAGEVRLDDVRPHGHGCNGVVTGLIGERDVLDVRCLVHRDDDCAGNGQAALIADNPRHRPRAGLCEDGDRSKKSYRDGKKHVPHEDSQAFHGEDPRWGNVPDRAIRVPGGRHRGAGPAGLSKTVKDVMGATESGFCAFVLDHPSAGSQQPGLTVSASLA